jgi:hypothetical protein|tara:strand:- start:2980 stop:3330 length:351 start_codon:yes stop_codon:yes gene_type:complete
MYWNTEMTKGLIIRKEWLDKILNNGKHWEMRATQTNQRGIIKLIEAGSGHIVGECMISGSHKVSESLAEQSFECHQVEDLSLLKKWCYAWRLCNVKRYDKPIPYTHPKGAVIWVNL